MFLEILGFLALVVFGIMLSLTGLLIIGNNILKYNIGGVPNSIWDKLFALLAIIFVVCYWVFVYYNSPFTITMKG
jgi:hypothetical protein